MLQPTCTWKRNGNQHIQVFLFFSQCLLSISGLQFFLIYTILWISSVESPCISGSRPNFRQQPANHPLIIGREKKNICRYPKRDNIFVSSWSRSYTKTFQYFFLVGAILHSLKLNIAAENWPSQKKVVFQSSIFRCYCYVSFRQGILLSSW